MTHEEEIQKWFDFGKISRLQELGKSFRKRAGDLYANGKDDAARQYRTFAQEFESDYEKERLEWDKKYPKEEKK